MLNKNEWLDEIVQIHQKLTELRQHYWLHYDLFTFQWWLLLALLVIPWVVWWRLVDKKRLKDIVFFGVLMGFLVFLLDLIGCSLNLWEYPYNLIRIIPASLAFDWGILPVFHMLLFQYFTKWRSYILLNILVATVFAFLCEPLCVWLGLYKLLNWAYVYSFPIYIIKAILIKGLFAIIERKQSSVNSEGLR